MKIPEDIRAMAREIVRENGAEIETAKERMLAKLLAMRKADKSLDALAYQCMAEWLVYQERHQDNYIIKREHDRDEGKVNRDHSEPKVIVGNSRVLGEVLDDSRSAYRIKIAGTMLGSIRFKDIPDLIEKHWGWECGTRENRLILEAVLPYGEGEQSVKDAVPERKLSGIVKKVRQKIKKMRQAEPMGAAARST